MRRDDAIPQVALTASVMDAMLELSRTGLGLVAVCDAQQQVQGVFTDGDLRRWLVGGGAPCRNTVSVPIFWKIWNGQPIGQDPITVSQMKFILQSMSVYR